MTYKLLWIIGSFVLALCAGPAAVLSAKAGVADASDIYVVLGMRGRSEVTTALAALGVEEISLSGAPFGRLVIALPDQHSSLNDAGYLVLPASALAGLCGLETPESW